MERRRKKKLEWIMRWTFHQKRTVAKLASTLSTTLTTLSRQFSWEPLRTFPLDRLPKELQLRVWELSRDEPRIIPLEAGCRKEGNRDGSIKEIMDCVALVKTPTILHVCRDSREIGLKIYKLRFEASLRHPIYFDSKCEVLAVISLRAWYAFSNFADLDLLRSAFHSIPFLVFDLHPAPGELGSVLNELSFLESYKMCLGLEMFEAVAILDDKLEVRDAERLYPQPRSRVSEWLQRYDAYCEIKQRVLRKTWRIQPPPGWPPTLLLSLEELRQSMIDRL